jgi:hypothetical protein
MRCYAPALAPCPSPRPPCSPTSKGPWRGPQQTGGKPRRATVSIGRELTRSGNSDGALGSGFKHGKVVAPGYPIESLPYRDAVSFCPESYVAAIRTKLPRNSEREQSIHRLVEIEYPPHHRLSGRRADEINSRLARALHSYRHVDRDKACGFRT